MSNSISISHYHTIIFDLGGVIINIDPPATFYALEQLFNTKIRPEDLHFDAYEKGQYSEDEYIAFLRHQFGDVSRADFFMAWNKMLLDIPPHRIELIKKLQKTHRVLLLSNTNPTHIVEIEKRLNHELNTSFNRLFDRCFLSYEMKMRKPDTEIYLEVKKQLEVDENAIFVDDNNDNVMASINAGIPAIVVDKDISEILKA